MSAPTWSVENRLLSQTLDGQALTWGYDASGQRTMKYQVIDGQPKWTFWFYDLAGRRVAQLGRPRQTDVWINGVFYATANVCGSEETESYFGGGLISRGLAVTWTWVELDRHVNRRLFQRP